MPSRHTTKWRSSSIILDLGNGWRWMVSFMPWTLYATGNPQWIGCRAGLSTVEKRFLSGDSRINFCMYLYILSHCRLHILPNSSSCISLPIKNHINKSLNKSEKQNFVQMWEIKTILNTERYDSETRAVRLEKRRNKKCWEEIIAYFPFTIALVSDGARGSVVVKGLLQTWRSRDRDPMRWMIFIKLPNPSGRTRPWGLLSL
jgi:hypothetical protein